jgi:hypothetical protein
VSVPVFQQPVKTDSAKKNDELAQRTTELKRMLTRPAKLKAES